METNNMEELRRELIELCWEIEKFPAGEQQTKVSLMASNLLQKLSKQVTEEELMLFILKIRKEFIDNERDQALPLLPYLNAQIFSHYILIPKED